MKHEIWTPPCLLKFIVHGDEIHTPVETGAFRHYVREIGPSEHPYFVALAGNVSESPAGIYIDQAVVC